MSDTVKTVLIVGGVAVGVVLLFKALSPTPSASAVAKKSATGTDIISVNGLISLGSAALGLFGGGSKSYPDAGTYHSDTSGFSIDGNTLEDSSGKTLVYGTD